MLRFYAYYKQATEGPNTMAKPNFWEVVKKAKWEAWAKLGNMSREQAMINYVEELKKVCIFLCIPFLLLLVKYSGLLFHILFNLK